jgi:hypothetical protein
MSIGGWIIFAICTGWTVLTVYFLFVRGKSKVLSSGRSDDEVISFYNGTVNSINVMDENKKMGSANEIVADEIKMISRDPDVDVLQSDICNAPIRDNDLIDLRSLSLNLSNKK